MSKNFSRDVSRVTFMERSLSSYSLGAILASCMALVIFSGPSLTWATDSNKKVSGHRLIDHQRIQDMKERVAELRERMKHHQHNGGGTTARTLEALQAKVTSLESNMAAVLSADSTMLTTLQAAQAQIMALQARIATLENRPAGGSGGVPDLEKYVSINPNPMNGVTGPHIIFKGVNVHVQSGAGATVDATTGLGNLIIGYNEPAQGGVGLNRTGSHNLVGGQMNSFSSSGGLVFGSNNKLSGRFAAVLGGEQNNAVGWFSTVYGGQLNQSMTNYSYTPDQSNQGCLGC